MKAAPLVLSVLVVTGPGFAQDIPVQMPAGALVLQTEDAFARVTFPVGSASNGDVPQDKQEGTVRTSVIQFPTKMSLDALMVNLR
ncbi:MAG: hypothetical protein QNJ03_09345, partial [Dinoroseobacter sp.]|nr:hypothetical protein [Dinoroseobacter sp.]